MAGVRNRIQATPRKHRGSRELVTFSRGYPGSDEALCGADPFLPEASTPRATEEGGLPDQRGLRGTGFTKRPAEQPLGPWPPASWE